MSKKEKLNMLIVDDEVDILKSLKRLFRRDFNITLASSGEEALTCIADQDASSCFDVILTDQRMKGMQGADLLKKVYAICGETASIIVTGYSDMPSMIKAINEGRVYGYMSKPWEPEQLKQMVFDSIKRLKSVRVKEEFVKYKELMTGINYWLTKTSLACYVAYFELNEKIRDIQLKTIDLSEHIDKLCSDFKTYAVQKEIDLINEPCHNCLVPIDCSIITPVLSSLFANALNDTEPKGKIVIRILDKKTHVRVEIQNIGIESDLHQPIANQTIPACRPGTENESGSDYGLLIVSKLLKWHNSCLDIKSNEKSGSLFGFNIQK
ncbi:MAG: hypothetical protein OMM_00531 [Candidatus Magnetoglobus multicellularis str. Araruama]|uniref:Response regulatory domain-containing protein n=1 Tax=Candidatus Magnetoglobus multicellularis str. Araruama TaxID=890399 RepID=A0A1V1PH35_9BACT|nr:MAG: hypothetical protein OMM_00531 [Candidatus Magnetoglobus multicellularis str. Araruama]